MAPVQLVLAGFAIVAALLAWSRWLAGRRWASAGHALLAVVALATLAGSWSVTRHLASYEPSFQGEAIAELFVEQLGSQRFRLTLTRLPSGRMQVFDLVGDEWQLSARTLAWTGHAADLGLWPRMRLERLASRASGTATGVEEPATAYLLAEPASDGDWPRAGSVWARVAVATERSSPWQPLVGGARFRVSPAAAGLTVAPLTDPEGGAG